MRGGISKEFVPEFKTLSTFFTIPAVAFATVFIRLEGIHELSFPRQLIPRTN